MFDNLQTDNEKKLEARVKELEVELKGVQQTAINLRAALNDRKISEKHQSVIRALSEAARAVLGIETAHADQVRNLVLKCKDLYDQLKAEVDANA